MAPISVSQVPAHTAAAMLAGRAHLDPRGICTERAIPALAAAGRCFVASAGPAYGQAVYVLTGGNGVAWVEACAGFGPALWADGLLPVIESQARGEGARAVAFQTARAGLVRKARRQGYVVAGWILKKELP